MIFKTINEALKFNFPVVKAKLISTEGSVPRDEGTFMLISSKYIFGSIGGGQLEYNVINKCKKILKENIAFNSEIMNIPLGPSIGQCCGGYVQIKLEKFNSAIQSINNEDLNLNTIDNLYIFGAGHIGQELSMKSINLDFKINLIDSREEYLNLQTNKNINTILAKYPWILIKNLPKKSYFIILTHSHDYDFKIINEILINNSFNFIGLIGSKTKFNRFKSRLIKLGHKHNEISKIECPIGLKNITSKKPSEIAISIIGRIIEFRSNSKKLLKDKNINILKKINE